MCERTCPECYSTEHTEGFGITGGYIVCNGCQLVLAYRRDSQAAPIGHPDPEQWARMGTFVRVGAEAFDPADDAIFQRQ